MQWTQSFYEKQEAWSGVYTGLVGAHHQAKAELIARLGAPPPAGVLELGAGGGQCAAAAADAGHTVWAVECSAPAVAHARTLAEERSNLTILEGDFYVVEPPVPPQVVCYWDGFGVGSDTDQRRLLRRIARWLGGDGVALIDIYTPWHAVRTIGRTMTFNEVSRGYDFEPTECRWLDRWSRGTETVTQSLRCYSPADLTLLLEGTGLRLDGVEPGPGPTDTNGSGWQDTAPLHLAMAYTAVLRADSEH